MTKPIIGITSANTRENGFRSPYYDNYYSLSSLYVDAVRRAGGIPVLLPPGEENIRELLPTLNGIIVSGGADVTPSYYGGNMAHPSLDKTDTIRDDSEISLVQHLVTTDIPTLCICRGLQVLNVAMGGSLYEHLPDVHDVDIHRTYLENGSMTWAVHPVNVDPDSRLAEALQSTHVDTYSGHHQAIKTLGTGLRITATAPDGIIEAVEYTAHPWLVGVQWHPEKSAHVNVLQQNLFDRFIEVAHVKVV